MKSCFFVGTLLAAIVPAASSSGANTVWIEAERFEDRGGWAVDAQFIDQMGSPYLLAVGLGKPVADAVTGATLPNAGSYRLWVRTKDWVPEHHPGRFQILLDGKPAGPEFGGSGKPAWHWEDGGVHPLGEKVELRLRDLTGYYGRCDAILLTDDLDFTPPNDLDAIAELREQYGGVSREIEEMPPHDVVVVGGGLAGCMAAVAAARNGASTVLIQNRPVLGGNASVEILVPPVGAHRPIRESGLIEEVRTAGNQRAAESWVYSGRLRRLVDAEENLDLLLDTHATGVEMKIGAADTIAAILAVDTRSGRRMRLPGRMFIDCTGDGVIGIWAGAQYRHGREARSVYDESLAPETGNPNTMGNSLKFAARQTDAPKPFPTPAWAYHFPECGDFGPRRHPSLRASLDWQWLIELGGLRDTYADAEEIRDDLLRVIYGMWDHIKNHCPTEQEEAARCELAWVGYIAGKRESNRLIGDYVMTEQDFTDQTLFPDRIAYGGWGLDDHPSAGFFYEGDPAHHVQGFGRVPHSVPFRSIYSKDVDNLLMAGRNISVTHVALGTTRVMLTCGVIGHAAGTAAGICTEKDTTPRGVYREHIADLQQRLLKEGAYLISLPNGDPNDLARSAEVTASSEASPAAAVVDGFTRPEGDRSHAWQPRSTDAGPHWVCLTWPKPQTLNTVHVTQSELGPFTIEAWLDDAWKTVAEVPDDRFRRNVLAFDDVATTRIRLVMAQPRAIHEIRVYREDRRQVEIARRAFQVMRTPIDGPGFPWGDGPVFQVRPDVPPRSPSGGAPGIAADKLPGIVLDAKDAVLTGFWTPSTHTGPYIGDGYLTDNNEGKGEKSIRFLPKLAKPGKYEIRFAYSALANRASNTLVTVHAAEESKSVRVNQRERPPIDGLFFPLGTFDLDAASSIVVSNAEADGYVIVDAVQLIAK
ncbi:MAG TPA: FAD-dependent oxidoreductase [Thermoguttaceae bacterium]|nr:FAD-dependent oxidoreductase [Thermoguttaceae bacterium]